MKYNVKNQTVEIRLYDIIEELTIEEKRELANYLVWDQEMFNELVERIATDTVVSESFSNYIYHARLRLMELLPQMCRETIRSLQRECAEAKADARRHIRWAYALYHAWPDHRVDRPKLEAFTQTPQTTAAQVAEATKDHDHD